MKDFVIDKISWHTRLDPNPEFQARVRSRFLALYRFLHSQKLLSEPLDPSGIESGGDFEIRASNLTPDGLALMKATYSKWLKSTDKKKDPNNVDLLASQLQKMSSTTE